MASKEGQEPEKFPKTLYVHEPLGKTRAWDGYEDYKDAEEDDTVGVYELKMIARIKINKETVLVDEETLKSDGKQ